MTKHKLINGWTKERVIAQLREKMPKYGDRAGVWRGSTFECRYRAPNGCCAAGAFIPDEAYLSSLEGMTIISIASKHIEDCLPLPAYAMLRLQSIHDGCLGNPVEACVEWVENNTEDCSQD